MDPIRSEHAEAECLPETPSGAVGEPKGGSKSSDPLAGLAVDANALAGAIWSGRGTDVSKLIEDLLRSDQAA